MTFRGAVFLLITVSFTVSGQILMKKGMSVISVISLKTLFTNPYLIPGGLCYFAGFFFWLNVLKILPLSIAFPSSSIAFILVVFASAIFLGEPVTLYKVLGVISIFGGVLLISRG